VRAIRRFTVRPVLPSSLRPLEDLVTNLRWSWHPETQDLFQSVSPEAWAASHHDPVRFLGNIPAERLRALGDDKRFIKRLELARADLEEYLTGNRWYQTLGDDAPRSIAYFSPEFGITAVLPQYSGGLVILAMLSAAVCEFTRPTNSSIIFGGSPAAGTTVGFGTNVGITPQRRFYQSGRVVSSILYPFGSSRNAMALLPVPCFMGPGSRTILTPLARNSSQAL